MMRSGTLFLSFALFVVTTHAQNTISCGETVTGSTVGRPNNFTPDPSSSAGDVSFTFDLPSTDPADNFALAISLCEADFATILALVGRDGDILAVNDDAFECSNIRGSFLRLTVSGSQSPLTFHVDGFSISEGNFEASLTCTELARSEFQEIECGDTVTDTTVGRPNTFEPSTLPPSGAGDLSFLVPLQSGSRFQQITVDACNADFDIVLVGRSLDGTILGEVVDSFGCPGFTGAQGTLVIDTEEVSTLVITIDGTGQNPEGTFTFTVSCLDLDLLACGATRSSGFGSNDFNRIPPLTAGEDENLAFVLSGNNPFPTIRVDLCNTTVRTHVVILDSLGTIFFASNIESESCSLSRDERPSSFVEVQLDSTSGPFALHVDQNDEAFSLDDVLSINLNCDISAPENPENPDNSDDDSDNLGVIVGAAVGGVAVLGVAAAFTGRYVARKNKKPSSTPV